MKWAGLNPHLNVEVVRMAGLESRSGIGVEGVKLATNRD